MISYSTKQWLSLSHSAIEKETAECNIIETSVTCSHLVSEGGSFILDVPSVARNGRQTFSFGYSGLTMPTPD